MIVTVINPFVYMSLPKRRGMVSKAQLYTFKLTKN